jgi:hypothetical protein
MRWWLVGLCALSLAGLLGCPHAFGRGGTIELAARKDIEEYTQMGKCPPGEEVEELCELVGEPNCLPECPR